jgi:hypothetical protein
MLLKHYILNLYFIQDIVLIYTAKKLSNSLKIITKTPLISLLTLLILT